MHLIIFDIDGTLTDTNYEDDLCYGEALLEVTGKSEDELKALSWHDCEHVTDSAIIDHFYQQLFGRNATEQEVEALKLNFVQKLEEKNKTHPQFFQEIPGAMAFFNSLHFHPKVALGIATGGWQLPAQFKLDAIRVNTDNVAFMGADEHYAKTHAIKRVIQMSQEQHNVYAFDKITYLGDRTYDHASSMELGINFLGIDYRGENALNDAGISPVVQDYNDLTQLAKLLEL